jgi:pSer/pThr/pTyr-binding forkhead associated (FHA) protein
VRVQVLLARGPARFDRGEAQRVLTFPAQQTVWIGRDATCEVVLSAQDVSRRHASLFVKEGQLFVRDHSSYGMQVDGRPLSRAVRALRPPSALELGPYRLEVTLAGDALQLRVRAAARWGTWRRWRAPLLGLLVLTVLGSWVLLVREPAADESAASARQVQCPPAPAPSGSDATPTVAHAVELLRSGDRLAALHAYRALATRDDTRAEYSIVASLLARELSCRP